MIEQRESCFRGASRRSPRMNIFASGFVVWTCFSFGSTLVIHLLLVEIDVAIAVDREADVILLVLGFARLPVGRFTFMPFM